MRQRPESLEARGKREGRPRRDREGVQSAQPLRPREGGAFAQGHTARQQRTGLHPGLSLYVPMASGCKSTRWGGHVATQVGSLESRDPLPTEGKGPAAPPDSSLEPWGLRGDGSFHWAGCTPLHLPSPAHYPACFRHTGHLHSPPPGAWSERMKANRDWFSEAPRPSGSVQGRTTVVPNICLSSGTHGVLSAQAHTFFGGAAFPDMAA